MLNFGLKKSIPSEDNGGDGLEFYFFNKKHMNLEKNG